MNVGDLRRAGLVLAAAAALAGLTVWLVAREAGVAKNRSVAGALALALAFTVLLSPHYPWYFLWLVPLLCLRLHVRALYLTVASVLLYELLLRANGPVFFRISALLYLPFALLVAVCWLAHRTSSAGVAVPVSFQKESRDAACASK